MNNRQKLVQQQFLNDEETVIKRLKQVYGQSLKDINKKVFELDSSISMLQKAYDSIDANGIGDLAAAVLKSKSYYTPEEAKETIKSMLQSKVYQKNYQKALQKQVGGILDNMQDKEFKTVSEYLTQCYENGFVGTMYDLQGQGIPLCFPLDQEQMVRAVQLDSKISKGLYQRLGEDVSVLKKKIAAQISRGISTGMSYQQVAQQLAGTTNIGFNNAVRIARTEGHRIQCQAGMDACEKAKEKGADVVKQWDSTMDSSTRESHVAVDGEIREIDEKFSNGLMFPGDPAGGAAEVINCRCALLQRARWALDEDELEELKKRAEYFGLDKSDNFNDYKQKYLKAAEDLTNDGNSDIISSGKSSVKIGGENVTITKGMHGFGDGNGGTLKPVEAITYTTPDGTQFIFPDKYDKAHQTMTPEQAIQAWQSVPQSIKVQAQKTIEFVDYYNPMDGYWRKIYKNFPQSYATGGDKITFYRWGRAHNIDYVTRTYCHEAGHYIDRKLATSATRFSNEPLWTKAMDDDKRISKKKSCTEYGKNSAVEDFAESIAEYVKDKAAFTKEFPNRAAILAGIIK